MRSNHRVRKTSLRRTISAALPLFLIVASFVTPLAAAQAADSPTGATIASDKADYAPGELVTLTGTGWAGDTTVNIEVNDTLGKSWQHIVDVPVVDGNITDSFNLPDRFVSDYDVTAKGLVNGNATTTFTDTVSTDYQHWLNDDANWSNGAIQQSNSSYKEGEVVPHVYDIKGGLSPSTSYSFRIFFDYKWDTKNICGFSGLDSYNASETTPPLVGSLPTVNTAIPAGVGSGSFYTVNANVTGISSSFQTAPSPLQRYVDVTFTTAAGIDDKTDVLLYWGLKLSLPNADGSGCAGARAWPGASLQTNVGNGPTGIPIGGGGTPAINPNAIQADSDVTVSKTDSPDPVAQSADLTYTITGTNNGPGTATNVQIVDTLPAFTTFKSYQVTSPGFTNVTCSASSGVVTCNGSSGDPLILIPGTPITIQIVVTVAANAPFAGTVKTGECQQNANRTSATAGVDLCNLVSISTTSIDTNPNNNSDLRADRRHAGRDRLALQDHQARQRCSSRLVRRHVLHDVHFTKAGSTTLSADINVVYPTPGNATTSIPLGYSCSVVEKTKTSPATDYSWTGESITGPVTITLGGADEITVPIRCRATPPRSRSSRTSATTHPLGPRSTCRSTV